MSTQSRIKKQKELMLDQLKKNPIVQIACEKVGVARATHYRWCKEDPEYLKESELAAIEGIALINDYTESTLLSAIQAGDINAAKFWLRANHHRYKAKVEFSGVIAHAETPMTPEQEELLKEALRLALPSNSQFNEETQ